LEAQVQAHEIERNNLAIRTKEWEASQAALTDLNSQHTSVKAQVKSLTDSLAAESSRRTTAEQKATELAARRSELEQELTRRSQALEQLQTQLAGQQKQLEAQAQAHQIDRNNLAIRTKEWEASQIALTELEGQHTNVKAQVKSLTDSLAAEFSRRSAAEQKAAELTARRNELEQELTRRSQALEQLRSELSEKQQQLDTQIQIQKVELGNLAARTKELAEVQSTLADLKTRHQSVTEQVQLLTESLSVETSRRTTAEQQAAELTARRTELEQELVRRSQVQEQLRTELAEKKQKVEVVSAELEDFRNRTKAGELRQKKLVSEILESEMARAELSEQLKAARELTFTRETTIHALENELQQRRVEHEQLNVQFQAEQAQRRRVEAQLQVVQSQLDEVSSHLAKKCAAEQVWLGRESEFQISIRKQQEEISKSNDTLAAQEEEIKRSRQQIEEMRTMQSALCVKVQEVTEQAQTLTASLTAETGRRTTFEQQAMELSARRSELEQELAKRSLAQKDLQAELEAQIRAHSLELSRLAERTKELEIAQAGLAEWKARHAAAEQVWTVRESEFQNRIQTQQDQIEKTGAALTNRENEIRHARQKLEELQVMQSALCAKVQALTHQGEAATKTIEEWQTKAARSEDTAENVQRKLAGLHYSILDASRMSVRLHRERSQKEQQNLVTLQQLLASLAQTPLSLAQRAVLDELQNSMDGLKSSRVAATKVEAFRVELPGLRDSHFCFAEVTESAFRAVRAAATAAGVAAQVSAVGVTTGKSFGYAEHIHQLITLLAASPLNLTTRVNALDLRVALEPRSSVSAELTVRVTLNSENKAQDLLAHLTAVTMAAATLQSGDFTEAEFGLAAGWQLAKAMGAQTRIEGVGTNDVCVTLSLQIDLEPAALPAENAVDFGSARNGNGSDSNGNRNGSGHNDDHGNWHGNHNGNQPSQPLVEAESKF
jgi:chromosome segregation ATPase